MPTPPLFDRYVIVDWSANSRPKSKKDSIWICSLGRTDHDHDVVENSRTRVLARERVRTLLAESVERHERVLVGFDFPYGYPRGFAAALGLSGTPWRATWDFLSSRIEDAPNNKNNRLAVASEINSRLACHAYWGRPAGQALEHLSCRMDVVRYLTDEPPTGLPEWREAERALHAQHRNPQPVWKLLGAGAVGSQALVGIPVVAALRDDPELAAVSRVWPFEGLTCSRRAETPAIVHAEIWPSIVDISRAIADPANTGKVRDQIQVEQLAAKFREDDLHGRLGSLLESVPSEALDEEGWVLGT